MLKLKKVIALLVTTMLVLSVLVGCGNNTTNNNSGTSGPSTNSEQADRHKQCTTSNNVTGKTDLADTNFDTSYTPREHHTRFTAHTRIFMPGMMLSNAVLMLL